MRPKLEDRDGVGTHRCTLIWTYNDVTNAILSLEAEIVGMGDLEWTLTFDHPSVGAQSRRGNGRHAINIAATGAEMEDRVSPRGGTRLVPSLDILGSMMLQHARGVPL